MKGKRRLFASIIGLALLGGVAAPAAAFLAPTARPATAAYAEMVNEVYFATVMAEANDSNLVYVDLKASGDPDSKITVTYRTYDATAIDTIDYTGIENTVELQLNEAGQATYRISVKCLNDANSRQFFRVQSGNNIYGRYFKLAIVSATNANIGEQNVCKCYLPYNYQTEATVGLKNEAASREIAYFNDYAVMRTIYNDGDGDIGDTEHWKTWKEGSNFSDDTSKQWVNKYINPGFADAYGSFLWDNIDDDWMGNDAWIHILAGGQEFMDHYERSSSAQGLKLYFALETQNSGAYHLNGKAFTLLAKGKNPNDEDDDWVDLTDLKVNKDHRQIYWYVPEKQWFAKANDFYDAPFWKVEPYNGVLNWGFCIYNASHTWDRQVDDIDLFLTLCDTKAPEIVSSYGAYNPETGGFRIFLRFDEPVYASKKRTLDVKINSYNTVYEAEYVEGNYGDTLVYEIPGANCPKRDIISFNYSRHEGDIRDMSYLLTSDKVVEGNYLAMPGEDESNSFPGTIIGGNVDMSIPQIDVDVKSSTVAKNIFNVMVTTTKQGGDTDLPMEKGTIYYTWDHNSEFPDSKNPAAYANKHVLTSEEHGSFGLTLAKNEAEGILSGDYYLHLLVQTNLGYSRTETFGVYRLDVDPPEVEQLAPEKDELSEKIFKLTVKDKLLGTAIDTVNLVATYENVEGKKETKKLEIVKNGEAVPELSTVVKIAPDPAGKATLITYQSNIDDNEETEVLRDAFILDIMGERNRLLTDIYFEVKDVAGNSAKTGAVSTYYDKRSTFDATFSVPESYKLDSSILLLAATVFDITEATSEEGPTFTVTDPEIMELIDQGAVFSVVVNDGEPITGEGYSVTVAGLEPGCYRMVAHITGMAGETKVDLVSDVYGFYLTRGFADETANKLKASGNLVLSNFVFEIPDVSYYYFDSAKSSVASHPYGATHNPATDRYDGGAYTPTFSSATEAKKYIKYMEYQDLELVAITSNIANLLNSGSGSTLYVKAANETKNAQAGQLWIRYKRANWTETASSSGWAYYYYGEGKVEDGINLNGLSSNLAAAIDAVTNHIVDLGNERYLVGESYISSVTGAPYLTEAQMHVKAETVSHSKMGSTYLGNNPTYAGDGALYRNTVTIEDNVYPIATNLALSVDSSTFLYKYYGGSVWNRVVAEDGTLLKDALADQVSGLYTFREYGPAGVSEFTVYIDKELPVLNVTVNEGIEGEESSLDLDSGVTYITGKNVVLNHFGGGEIASNEADDQTYVALYTYPREELVTVMYAGSISGYVLKDANYYMTVGDRSGNVCTYIIRTVDSPIDLSVTENAAKTAVYVTVSNRNDNEIYSYEVYLNDVILDNEFATNKIYRAPGIYRVEVSDIYNNHVTRIISHEALTPELKWYYRNDEEGYNTYDPEHPVRMILVQDTSSPRTTNVYSSSPVRVMFVTPNDSETVGFELTDVPTGDYTYNEGTNVLTINSLASWKLRVWYGSTPENDHIYLYSVDNDAPEVSATVTGTRYSPYVLYDGEGKVVSTSSFENIDLSSYQLGDVVSVDTLQVTNDGQGTISFENGSIVGGKRVVVKVEDSSGIRGVEVTRNGQPIEVALTLDNELIFSDYGSYNILVTDNLGNVATFSFTNAEEAISLATLDGEAIVSDVENYGHNALDIEGLYEGVHTLLIKTEEGMATYELHFEGGVLTYGQYFVDYGEDNPEVKAALFKDIIGFSLNMNADNTRRDYWYPVIENPCFTLYAEFDADGQLHLKVTPMKGEVYVEARFSVSKAHLPSRYIAIMSLASPQLTLLTGGQPVDQKESLDFIYISDTLTIDKTAIADSITTIQYVYSENTSFGEPTTIYENGTWLEELVGEEFGYYQIVVMNKYGNKNIYTLSKIAAFGSVVKVITLDGAEVIFNKNEGTIHSNYTIELTVMSAAVTFEVNGTVVSGYSEGGVTILTLNHDGDYSVRVVGENGVFEDFTFQIMADMYFLYDESWIVGYNEEALLRDQGYTNTRCSVELGKDVVYVDLVVNDETHYVLYDNVTESKQLDPEALIEVIGRYGTGKYVVGFRNKYGDLVTKAVYFNDVPSITLGRTTTSDPNSTQVYDLNLAIEKGFYSNNVLIFSTTSETYRFTVSGVEIRLDQPKTIEFSNSSGKGSFSYEVTYLDEYGNYVEFEAILYRADVEFDATKMKTLTVGTTLYTKDDVVIEFAEGLKATVKLNDGEEVDYTSGTLRFADGQYLFTVRDIAGNKSTYTINHKSVVHYSFTNSGSGETISDGGVINNSNVVFSSSEQSKIKYIVRNGELVTDYNSTTFSTSGHYQVVIEDVVGNLAYKEFTIINNELATFDYNAPYDYEISEVWRAKADGTRELLNIRGPSIHLDENGDYLIVAQSTKTASSFNFSVTINNAPPTATLVGATNGEVTARDVSITGLRVGDVVKIYKDGVLVSNTTISLSTDTPTITTGGKYRVTITNIQGTTVTYHFTRKAVTNVAGSVFIIVSSVLAVIGIGVGLIYHTKLRTDE